jgi:D-alanyl-D-alanine dipeptidase
MNLPATAIKNRALLETIMEQHGFEGLPTEWWHFDFQGWERFPISDRPID